MRSLSRNWVKASVVAVAAALAAPVAAQTNPTLVGSYRDWFVYTTGTGADRICYALSQPRQTQPTGVNRGPIFFLISTWPGKDTADEPSVIPGYPYREGSSVEAQIGSDRFEFFTRNEGTSGGAWMEDQAVERRLVDAMKRGATMIVTGTSTRGTLTRDTYSLAGVTAALDSVRNACR